MFVPEVKKYMDLKYPEGTGTPVDGTFNPEVPYQDSTRYTNPVSTTRLKHKDP